ncbi:hypothetical protein GCM10007941_29430 [Amphritea balenae]|nr:hypothetical protein GCM10007941_29430 [Amphritea balenae]
MVLALVLIATSALMQNLQQFNTTIDGAIYPILSSIAFGIFIIRISKIKNINFWGKNFLIEIGKKSYSIYLLHFFTLDIIRELLIKVDANPSLLLFLTFSLTILLTTFFATLTMKYIEKPFIDTGSKIINSIKRNRALINFK